VEFERILKPRYGSRSEVISRHEGSPWILEVSAKAKGPSVYQGKRRTKGVNLLRLSALDSVHSERSTDWYM
jgi:hypothetical protein